MGKKRIRHIRHGELTIVVRHGSTADRDVVERFAAAGFRIGECSVALDP
jgi:hypothetical protein